MAVEVYGRDIAQSFEAAKSLLCDEPDVREKYFDEMQITEEWRDALVNALGLPARRLTSCLAAGTRPGPSAGHPRRPG